MRGQLKRLGYAIDWSREFATCDPAYYGHEQALFLDLFAAGLVYRKQSEVNWDPVDMTVLANEQVIDGRGWRSGALVERRKLNQWFLKITDFRRRIARRSGLARQLAGQGPADAGELDRQEPRHAVPVRPVRAGRRHRQLRGVHDAPRHHLRVELRRFVAGPPDRAGAGGAGRAVRDFIAECKRGGTTAAELETAEKQGFDTGLTVAHPLDPDWRLPVYIANFVLMDYGTGAIFGVPAHDQRDFRIRHQISPADPARGGRHRRGCDAPVEGAAESGEGISSIPASSTA
jgi:leucyl-tRNA synthetase